MSEGPPYNKDADLNDKPPSGAKERDKLLDKAMTKELDDVVNGAEPEIGDGTVVTDDESIPEDSPLEDVKPPTFSTIRDLLERARLETTTDKSHDVTVRVDNIEETQLPNTEDKESLSAKPDKQSNITSKASSLEELHAQGAKRLKSKDDIEYVESLTEDTAHHTPGKEDRTPQENNPSSKEDLLRKMGDEIADKIADAEAEAAFPDDRTLEEMLSNKDDAKILERECWRVLKVEDKHWNKDEYTNQLTPDLHLQRKDGVKTDLRPSMVIHPELVKLALERTKNKIALRSVALGDISPTSEVARNEDQPVSPNVESQETHVWKAQRDGRERLQTRMDGDKKLSKYESMSVRELAKDERAGPILDGIVLEYLKKEDPGWTGDEFTGELNEDGYLIRKDGKTPSLKPYQCIGGINGLDAMKAMDAVLTRTREELQKMEDIKASFDKKPEDVIEAGSELSTNEENNGTVGEAPFIGINVEMKPEVPQTPFSPMPEVETLGGDYTKEAMAAVSDSKKTSPQEIQEGRIEKGEKDGPWEQARNEYREHRKAMLEAEQEWQDAVKSREDEKKEKLFGLIFDSNHRKDQAEEALQRYNALLDKTRAEREKRIGAFLERLSSGESKNEKNSERAKRIIAFHEAILDRHIDQKAGFVERISSGKGMNQESSERYRSFTGRAWQYYRALPPHKKILLGTAVAAGAGLILGATGVVAGGAGAVGLAMGGRRFAGGTVGVGTMIGTKLGFDKFAEKRAEKQVEKTKEEFSEKKLSETLSRRMDIDKQKRNIKTAGTVAAVGAAVASGVTTSGVIEQLHNAQDPSLEVDLKDVDVGKGLKNMAQGIKTSASKLYSAVENEIKPDVIPDDVPSQAEIIDKAPAEPVPESIKDFAEQPYVVKEGDNLWAILEKQIESNDSYKNLHEAQKIHFIDSLKDKIVALPGEELKSIGINSENANVIRVGEELDLSKVLNKDTVQEALTSSKNLSPEQIASIEAQQNVPIKVTDATYEATPKPANLPAPETVTDSTPVDVTDREHIAAENIPVSGEITADDDIHAEEITPNVSEEAIKSSVAEQDKTSEVVKIEAMPDASSEAIETTQESVSESVPKDGLRRGDFPRAHTELETAQLAMKDYHALDTRPVIEKLFTEENIFSKTIDGQYQTIRSNWGAISRVNMQDVFDHNNKLTLLGRSSAPIELGADTENLVRSMLIQIENGMQDKLPNINTLFEQAQKENWTVGKFVGELGKEIETNEAAKAAYNALTPESEASVEMLEPEAVATTVENVPAGKTISTDTPTERTSTGRLPRPRRVEPLFEAEIGGVRATNEYEAGGRVGVRIGGNKPIRYVGIHTGDQIAHSAEFKVQEYLKHHPEWADKTAGELLEQDESFAKTWRLQELVLRNDGSRAPMYRTSIDPNDMETLKHMKGDEALRQIHDEIYDRTHRRAPRTIARQRYHPFR